MTRTNELLILQSYSENTALGRGVQTIFVHIHGLDVAIGFIVQHQLHAQLELGHVDDLLIELTQRNA